MAVDFKMIFAQQKELKGYADDIAYVKNQIRKYQNNLNSAWNSTEIRIINDAIDNVERKLAKMEAEMDDISMDILSAYQELEETQTEEV